MHVDVILTDHSTENSNILGITNLDEQFSATLLNISSQNLVAVFRYPNKVNG